MARKRTSSLETERRLLKKTATSMTRLVNDLTKLRKVTEEIQSRFDEAADSQISDMMYRFYNEVAQLEEELDTSHYSIKQMYEELGGTDVIPDPIEGQRVTFA